MLDDVTLREVFHIRVSLLGAISVITLGIVALIVLLSVLIVYTPIRNILPGYSESLRQQLIQESARVDSLQTSMAVDSVQVVERTQLLEERSEATDAFMAQYEQKERDRLQLLFVNSNDRTMRHLYRPVRGAIVLSARPDLRQYSTVVRTAAGENVMATSRGTLVSVERMADNTLTLTLQNGAFITIYRGVSNALKGQGAQVEQGESIGLMDGDHDLSVELWDAGQFVNPEEVIVW